MVSASSLTPFCKTVWLRTQMPRSINSSSAPAADGRDFVRVVEMRVQRDFLVALAPRFDNPRKGMDPLSVCDEFLRHNRRGFRRVAHPPHMFNVEQSECRCIRCVRP